MSINVLLVTVFAPWRADNVRVSPVTRVRGAPAAAVLADESLTWTVLISQVARDCWQEKLPISREIMHP